MKIGFKRGSSVSQTISKIGHRGRIRQTQEDSADAQTSGMELLKPRLLQRHSFVARTMSRRIITKAFIGSRQRVPAPGSGKSKMRNTTVSKSSSGSQCDDYRVADGHCSGGDRESHLTQNRLSQENLLKHTQYVSVTYILGQLYRAISHLLFPRKKHFLPSLF